MSPSRTAPSSPIPVTLLSGFLGSGKTTLLRHILTSPETNLRVAVVVNDMAALNIDAALIKKHIVSRASEEEKLIQLQNGCICCTLRGDLLEALVKLARDGQADHIVIESTGISEPMQVAETFTEEFAEAMRAAIEQNDDGMEVEGQIEGKEVLEDIAAFGGLHKLVKLSTLITMVDAYNFFDNFETTEFITNRWGKDDIAPEDERTVTDLMVDQIEFANTIIINKTDSVDQDTLKRIRTLVQTLNPDAKILNANFAVVNIGQILVANFDFEKAATGMGWLRSLHEMSKREVNGKIKFAPKPETEEYGISSFVYRARRPFHPKRLYQMIHDKFVLMEDAEEGQEDEEDEEDEGDDTMSIESDRIVRPSHIHDGSDNESWEDASDEDNEAKDSDVSLSNGVDPKIVAENKRNSVFRGLLRSKGFVWLATRPTLHGSWSQAGTMLTLQGGEQWFCALDSSQWPEGETIRQSILADFQKPWGDRRQELVLIGEKLDQKALTTAFDECLLRPLEMQRWERAMKMKRSTQAIQDKLDDIFEDGFADWADPATTSDGLEHNHSNHKH